MGFRLILCEKPSVAQTISAVIGATKRRDGFFEGGGWLVSWCYGHLVELAPADAYGEQYKRWSYDSLPILPDVWKYRASEGKKKQLDILRALMNRADVDSIILATDAGREGELIGRLVYEQAGCKKPVQRLWLMSLEDSAIREGLDNLRPSADYDNLYHAALCRAKADYMVGINATRLFTCLYGLTLNVGRVQSPTLALIVNREAVVREFVAEPFYVPEIYCDVEGFVGVGDNAGGTDGATSHGRGFTVQGERLTDSAAAEVTRSAADGQDAVVISVEKQHKTTAPPKLYDLTGLQRDANRLLGFTAQQTLDYVQSAYEKKLCSYPRSDSRYLPSDMAAGLPGLVRAVAGVVPFSVGIVSSSADDGVGHVDVGHAGLPINTAAVINDQGVSDHFAIIPTAAMATADLSALPKGERDILLMIAARLLCAVGEKHSYETVTAVLDCGGHMFTAKGKTTIADGWKAVDGAFRATIEGKPGADDDSNDGSALPELVEGQVFPSVTASVKTGKTSSPQRYNDATLLTAMETAGVEDFPDDTERKGLGTPSTRAATIEKIIKTGFVERQKKSLVPTAKGINLINILPEDIKSPLLTAEWEQRLKLVEQGLLSAEDFMGGIASLTQALVAAHHAPAPEYAALFAETSTNNTAANPDAMIGDCPRCGSAVVEKPKKGTSTGRGTNTNSNTDRLPDYYCTNRACRFCLWRNNRFFEAKRKKLDKKTAIALLTEGRVFFSDLHSERTGKTYAATIVLDDGGAQVNFKLEFTKGRDN